MLDTDAGIAPEDMAEDAAAETDEIGVTLLIELTEGFEDDTKGTGRCASLPA